MRKWLIPLLFLSSPLQAQDTPAPPPGAPADQLAFGDEGSRMTVPVSVAGAGPYRFIIDTGAQRTVISRELASTLGLPRGRDVRMTAMTGTSQVATVVIPSVGVSSIAGKSIEAPALERVNLGAPGMLGIDTLQGHSVSIDFDQHVMAVTPSSRRRRHEARLPDEIVVTARNLLGELVVTDAYCDGRRVRVILDTGSAVSMGNLALRRMLSHRAETTPITLTSVTGEKLIADYTTIDKISFGGLEIGHLPIAYADVRPFQVFGLEDRPAIMLGMDALGMFRRVEIDFANREVRLLLPRGTPTRREMDWGGGFERG